MRKTGKVQLPLQAFSMVVGFSVWVIISSLMPFIKEDIKLTPGEVALVAAIPVILGSLLRVPVGYFTNRYGAKLMHTICFITLLFPVFLVSIADSMGDLILGGLFLGIGGTVFSVGVTSIPKYYPKEKHGMANGIYGLGNAGTAVSTFFAPVLANEFGWRTAVQCYLVMLVVFIALTIFLGDKDEPKVKTALLQQIKSIYKMPKLWFFSLFYFLTFGAFVAFTVFLPNYLVTTFNVQKVDAGLMVAVFIVCATLMRPTGGVIADKVNGFILLMIVFSGIAVLGICVAYAQSLTVFMACVLALGIFAGIGNGTMFKLVPHYFLGQVGIVNGVVSAMGGLGGFFPPLILANVFKLTGSYILGFAFLSSFAVVCLIITIALYKESKTVDVNKVGTAQV